MKIDSVEAIPLEMPLNKVFSGSGYRVATRNTIVTRIRTAGGLASDVYNGDNRSHGRAIARIVEDELAPYCHTATPTTPPAPQRIDETGLRQRAGSPARSCSSPPPAQSSARRSPPSAPRSSVAGAGCRSAPRPAGN
jgi:hypothetical protein